MSLLIPKYGYSVVTLAAQDWVLIETDSPAAIFVVGTQSAKIHVSPVKRGDKNNLTETSYARNAGALLIGAGKWWLFYNHTADAEALVIPTSNPAEAVLLLDELVDTRTPADTDAEFAKAKKGALGQARLAALDDGNFGNNEYKRLSVGAVDGTSIAGKRALVTAGVLHVQSGSQTAQIPGETPNSGDTVVGNPGLSAHGVIAFKHHAAPGNTTWAFGSRGSAGSATNPGANVILVTLDTLNCAHKTVALKSSVAATVAIEAAVQGPGQGGNEWIEVESLSLTADVLAWASAATQDRLRGFRHVRLRNVNAITGTLTHHLAAQP